MHAEDVMVTDVLTARPDMDAKTAAAMLADYHVSALPVLDGTGRLVGILSEGDLIRRAETGTDRRPGGWLDLLFGEQRALHDFVRSHARKVKDLMTPDVVTAAPDTPLADIAALFEKHRIKRVPILADGQLVGIVSRANLVQALARRVGENEAGGSPSDRVLRARVLKRIREVPGIRRWLINATVEDGVVDLWGPVRSDIERRALLIAAEGAPGARKVRDNFTAPAPMLPAL